MIKYIDNNKSNIKNIVIESFLFSIFIILVIAIIGAFYLNDRSIQSIRETNLQKSHEILSSVLSPALEISDTSELRKILSLASDKNSLLSVIDNNENIIIPDYSESNLVEKVVIRNKKSVSCDRVKNGLINLNGKLYWINCSLLESHDIRQNKSLGILISFSKYPFMSISSSIIHYCGIVIFALVLITFWFRRVLHKQLLEPLVKLEKQIVNAAKSPLETNTLRDISCSPKEISAINNAFQNVLTNLQIEYRKRNESEKKIALSDLTASVAHDIQSPLVLMEINLKLLTDIIPDTNLKMLHDSVNSLRDVSDNLLERYRSTTEKFADLNSVSLFELIKSVLSDKRIEWQRKNVKLIFHSVNKQESAWVRASPTELKRILSNLLNNADDAISSCGEIEVYLDRNDPYWQIRITDHGIGITQDKISMVLNGLSLKHPGKGLGLSTAKYYIEKIGGKLELCSNHREGTVVSLLLPSEPIP